MDPDPLSVQWSPAQVGVMQRLHEWSERSEELSRRLADWMALPNSDANALGHVVWAAEEGRPITPADLARQTGMTSGATTALVDRLERAGLVRRSREQADRRRVTLRPEESARERVRAFLAAAGAEVAEVLQAADEDDLARVAAFLERVNAAVATANGRLGA